MTHPITDCDSFDCDPIRAKVRDEKHRIVAELELTPDSDSLIGWIWFVRWVDERYPGANGAAQDACRQRNVTGSGLATVR